MSFFSSNLAIWLLATLAVSGLTAGTITIFNDSAFLLNAEILAADGTKKGALTITPQQRITWQDTNTGNNTWSQTPYTVLFSCKNGGEFGVYNDVSPGATITASTSVGARYCQPEKKKSQPSPPSKQGPYIDPNLGPP